MTIIVVPKRKMLPLQQDTVQPKLIDTGESILPLLVGYLQAADLIGYLKNLVEDLTPQLGGNLDINGHTISGLDYLKNMVEDLTPGLGGDLNTRGKIITVKDTDGTTTVALISGDGSGNLNIVAPSGTGNIRIVSTDGDVEITGLKTTWGDVTASRAYDTEYHNTTGEPKVVVVTGELWQDEQIVFEIGAATGSRTEVGRIANLNLQIQHLMGTIIVPIGYYYQVTKTGTPALHDWHEYGIGD